MIVCRALQRIYYNEGNGYTVALYQTDEALPKELALSAHPGRFTAVGTQLPAAFGLTVELSGKWTQSNYGMQFVVSSFHVPIPETTEGIRDYLASGLIKGIGPLMAKRIVDRFGEKTFRVLEEEPERLLAIRGITENKLEVILENYQKSSKVRELMVCLAPMGVTPRMAEKIMEHFGGGAVGIVKENPYRLCEIKGFGFKTVDPIAMQSRNFQPHTPERLKAALHYALREAEKEGHLYLTADDAVERAMLLMNYKGVEPVLEKAVREAGNELVYRDRELRAARGKRVYLPEHYLAERSAAKDLRRIDKEQSACAKVDRLLEAVQAQEKLRMDETQKEAVRMVFRSGVSLITGPPGSGKTTIIRMIVRVQEELDRDAMILLCAPTGRARRRMYESTGYPALTIHKALGLIRDEEAPWNDRGTLWEDLIVVDECSMVDMKLAAQLFAAVKQGARLVLVGDQDQLPSVGPGNVFAELIASGVIPMTALSVIFRQDEGSTILENAERINRGDGKLLFDSSFQLIQAADDKEAAEKIREIYRREWLANGRKAEAVQVLSPLRQDTRAGADALNAALRDIVNPQENGKRQIWHAGRLYREKDKVMQTENEDEISNGDVGMVVHAGKKDGKDWMEVDFGEGRVKRYGPDDAWPVLAYAMSVHKGQGSEYPVVILPVLPCFWRMLKRNLFYTAVTRAKRKVILVGSWKAIWIAVKTNDSGKRNTLLGELVREEFQKADEKKIA